MRGSAAQEAMPFARLMCCKQRSVRPSPSSIRWLCVLALIASITGCSGCGSTQQANMTQQSVVKAQHLSAATAAAASVLADVEACETAVRADSSVDVVSQKVAHARTSVNAFSRSENGRLLPNFTSAIVLSEQEYLECVTVWRVDEKVAQANPAAATALQLGNGSLPADIAFYKVQMRHRVLWVDAALDLGRARLALRNYAQ